MVKIPQNRKNSPIKMKIPQPATLENLQPSRKTYTCTLGEAVEYMYPHERDIRADEQTLKHKG